MANETTCKMEHWGPVSFSPVMACAFVMPKNLLLFTLLCETHKLKKQHCEYSSDSAGSLWLQVHFEQVGRFVWFLLSFVFNFSENEMNNKKKGKKEPKISSSNLPYVSNSVHHNAPLECSAMLLMHFQEAMAMWCCWYQNVMLGMQKFQHFATLSMFSILNLTRNCYHLCFIFV